jgi:pseudaminic acid cytidylyltransferase
MNCAIIPARGGSKRIPKKNIIDFCGKPMIAWSIEAAKKSECFDRIIISTDDDEIAEISIKFGGEILFKRPDELSDDFTSTSDVIAHAIKWFIKEVYEPQLVCCIYATAPLIDYKYIQNGYEIIANSNLDFVFSATDFSFPVQRSFFLDENHQLKMLYPEHYKTRSQDLKKFYHDAGQFYWGKTLAWVDQKEIFSRNSKPILIPNSKVQDIDTLEDLEVAKIKFSRKD